MTQVILQPASGVHPTEHYRETIEKPVPLERIRPHISDELFVTLKGLYPEGRALVWGAIPGVQNTPKWDRMQTGAIVLFYKDKKFISSAQLTLKTRNSQLARELWKTRKGGETWELVFFLKDLHQENLPYTNLQKTIAFGPRLMLRALTVLDPARSETVLDRFTLRRSAVGLQAQNEILEAIEVARSASRGQGYAISKEQRRALELHAMNRAERVFRGRGYDVENVSSWSPYDLRCNQDRDVLYVEVKGTKTRGDEVLLTTNEVEFARRHKRQMVLFVVHSIQVTGDRQQPETSGGVIREVRPWDVDIGTLTPTGYSYSLEG